MGFPAGRSVEILDLLQRFYNGYCFGESDDPPIYNPTLALYFLDYFSRYGRYPRQMLGDNLAMDRNRIQYVARLPHGETLVNRALNPAEPLAIAQLVNRFGVQDMLTAPRDPDFLASLLYYFGVLTQAGRDEWGALQLTIPNQVIRKLYVERLRDAILNSLNPLMNHGGGSDDERREQGASDSRIMPGRGPGRVAGAGLRGGCGR
ncbi:MAG: hypothetical protein RKO24_03675 [Candidatus Competibacter sp.]|nr:hypothetical protein [Candidatus Competibacter sp.]